ncbi:hypothetical protein [Paenibacillus sp. DMB20]|uniref:hypothetical protein n=1 Tax=Paenibacillus sp. DMB20 TaxID=1642570 RepID=UPI000A827D7E
MKKIPMCGVPYHSAEGYIQRLIEKGYKVAICEQMEDASATKGMVRREIVRVVTPGTIMEGKAVSDKSNNYMVCLTTHGGLMALAACDLSTGELYVTSVPASEEWLRDEIGIYEPSEMIGDSRLLELVSSQALPTSRPVLYTAWERRDDNLVRSQFGGGGLGSSGRRAPGVRFHADRLFKRNAKTLAWAAYANFFV